ncbi:Ig-like domain-containing protein [Bradyrhizobium sp. ma5]|uniref:Ig-like domain-containing protein n=1 Tax=Bradyrhizobium sp. ma5 TaxID=3344828 RepID=UPI0035D51A76
MAIYNLTTSNDTIVGTSGADTFNTTASTLNPGDSLNGGGGSDTLNLLGSGTFRIDQLAQFTGISTVSVNNSSGSTAYVYLGSQSLNVNEIAGPSGVYLGSGTVTINNQSSYGNSVYSQSNTSWNATDAFTGVAQYIYLYGSNYDLTSNSFSNDYVYAYGSNETIKINSSAAAGVLQFYGNGSNTILTTSDAALDLSHTSVSNLAVTSTNAAGTTFTVHDATTALSIQGGPGTDTIVASGFNFSQAQRDQIFGFTSVEVLKDSTGTYTPTSSPHTIYLTTSNDSIVGTSGNDTFNTLAGTLNSGDSLNGGGGSDTLSLLGSGTFRIDQLAQFTGISTVSVNNSSGSTAYVYLGSQSLNVNEVAGSSGVYLGSGTVTINNQSSYGNSVYSQSNTSWNATDAFTGVAQYIYLYGSNYDLTSNSFSSDYVYAYGSNETIKINSSAAAGVLQFYGNGSSTILTTSDAALDLSHTSVSNLTITSTNAAGTTFTVRDATTALSIQGGPGTDTIVASGFNFSQAQRDQTFGFTSVEVLKDSTGTYTAPAASPHTIYLTTSNDSIVGTSGNDTFNTLAGTLNSGDSLNGGGGSDTLNLLGSGTFRIDQLAQFTGISTVSVNNSSGSTAYVYLGSQSLNVNEVAGSSGVYLGSGTVTINNQSSYGNSVYSQSNTSWNATDAFTGVAQYIYLYGSNYDLTSNSFSNDYVYAYGSNETIKINSSAAAGVLQFYGNGSNTILTTSDAALDLSHTSVSNLAVTSTNAAGTTFTVHDATTALSIQGGLGTDTIVASGFNFSQAQRDQIFGFTSVEILKDSTGTYTSPYPSLGFALASDTGLSSTDRYTSNPAVAGSGDPNATVTVTIDGATVSQPIIADSSGHWSYLPTGLADGSHAVTASETNSGGYTRIVSLNFTLDTRAPSAPTSVSDSAVINGYVNSAHDTSSQVLTGRAEANAIVTIYDGQSNLGTATADGSGNWSFTLGSLADGSSHSLTATATDAAGNTGVASAALAFTVDTRAPVAPTSLADASIASGYVNAANDTATQKLTGSAEAGSTVTVYDGSTLLGTVAADATTGAWSFTLGHLADGSHSLTATATDAAGNTGVASSALAFNVDTQAPVAPTGLADASIASGYVNAANDTATQKLTGSAEAGSTVTVYDGSTLLGTVAADATTGAWSFTLGHLADGSHSLTATASDSIGNASVASSALAFNVDTQAPVAPTGLADASIASGYVNAANDTATQKLTGSAEAGSTVTVYDGSTLLGTAAADATTGAWSFTLGHLADGSHSLTATATDAAGNTGIASSALAFNVDTQAPVAPTGLADASIVNGYVNAANDTATQKLTGSAEAGSTVTVYDGATKLGTAAADATTGAWSFTLGHLADGSHSLTATATDAAGNTGVASSALAFNVDTQAPVAPTGLADASIASGYVNAANDTATQKLTGSAEAGSTVTVYDGSTLLGTVAADATTGAWSFTLGHLADGSHSLTATATDAAGNTGVASSALAFNVDTQAPVAPTGLADASIANGYVNAANDTATQKLTGSAEAASTVTVYDGATKLGTAAADATTGAWSFTLGHLADGSHSLTATATDAAGNTGVASSALAFNVDTQAPVAPTGLADASIANGYVNAANDTATQKLTGSAEAGSTVTVYDGSTLLGTVAADATTGAWSFTLGHLADGSHSLTATATDAAGNTGVASSALAFNVDTQAPVAPTGLADASIASGYVNAANDTATQKLTGSAEAGSTVTVYDGSTLLGTAAADATTGAWSFTLGHLADGSHSLTATATDAAGNTGVASSALAFNVDTQAPVAPTGLADASIANGYVNAANDTATQKLTGSAEAGSTVTVYDGSTLLGTVAADATTGAWSFTLGHLADGSHSLTATATDAAGNTGVASSALAFNVDTQAPVAPTGLADASIASGYVNAANDTATQKLTGSAEAGSTVTVYDGSTLLGTAAADATTGAWSFTLGHLADGSHSLTATATDAAGNTGVASSALAFNVDTQAPVAPTGLADASIANGYVNAANDTATQKLTGSAEAGSTVTVYDGSTLLGTVAADATTGAWSFTLGHLADGSHSLTATATDAAGNTGVASSALAFNVDTQAPVAPTGLADASIASGYVNAANDTATQKLTGSAEAGSTVTVYDGSTLLGTAAADATTGAWSFTLGHLADGSHSLRATATDAAGNTGVASSALAFNVDTQAPVAPTGLADASIANGYVNAANDTATQKLTGSAEAGSTVTVYDGSTLLGTVAADATTGAWSFTLGHLADGSHSLTATATDAAGNTGVASSALAFNVDTQAPVAPTGLADASIANGYVNAANDTATQKLTGSAEAGSTVTVYDGSTLLGTVAADATTGAWSFTLGHLADGSHSLTATATDAAGNTGVASSALAFNVDTQAPVAPTGLADASIANGYVNAANDTATQKLTGSAEAGSTVTVYDGSTLLGTVAADATTGAWSFTLGHLADGSHSLTATATDAAGNTGVASSALAFNVDTQAPVAPTGLADASIANGYVNAANDTATQKLTGSAEAGSTVTVYDGATKLGTAAADATTGAWNFTLGHLADGSHSLTATATDAAGNTGIASSALAFNVDTQAPVAPTGLADASIVNGYVNAANDTATQKLTGSAEAGSTVTVYDGATKLGTAAADATTGAWSFALGALADGSSHSLTATATDAAGNTSVASSVLAFKVDTHPPVAPTGLADASIVNGYVNAANDTATQKLTGSAEADSTVTVYDGSTMLGTAVASHGGTWSFTLGHLADGSHSLTATATDAAGNTGVASSALAFNVDTKAPVPAIVNITPNISNNLTTLTGTSEANSSVQILDGKTLLGTVLSDANGHWVFQTNVTGGAVHTFSEVAKDASGNVGSSAGVALYSPSANLSLNGGTGNDVLIGRSNDSLTGGGGSDTFVFNAGFGKEIIKDFSVTSDFIEFAHGLFSSAQDVLAHTHDVGGTAVITLDANDTLTLTGVKSAQLLASDFHLL